MKKASWSTTGVQRTAGYPARAVASPLRVERAVVGCASPGAPSPPGATGAAAPRAAGAPPPARGPAASRLLSSAPASFPLGGAVRAFHFCWVVNIRVGTETHFSILGVGWGGCVG